MIWYLAFTAMFLLYQLDVLFYSAVALIARVRNALRPPPGHPAYHKWHKDRLVEPPECDARGYKLGAGPEGLSDLLSKGLSEGGKASEASLFGGSNNKPSGWHIGTTAAPGSVAWSIAASSSCAASSECSGSVAGGESHPSTPKPSSSSPSTKDSNLAGAGTGQDEAAQTSTLQTVYSLPQVADPACGLEIRTGDFAGQLDRTSRDSSSDPPMSGGPPPSTAVLGPDDIGLLPASLVDQYSYYPLVLVQLPMYNEEAHCEVVIERAANIVWPRHRIVIQVCDDSTRDTVKQRIDAKVLEMRERGHNCLVTRRSINAGFKAGNMINGMNFLCELEYEYVAVFDADFEMPPDFLYQTVYHLQQDSRIGFVQTRWSFTNSHDNMLCWMQAVCLNYHFAVEQRARSFLRTFFGFNGTAGVWRRTAMEQAGGWNMDSTVEDMDLSLRAFLNGWKFKYLHWVSCPNELPPTMSAYKTQQYRWNSGPMVVIKQLIRRCWTTNEVTILDRISCTYFFFRFIYSAFLTVICLLCPAIIVWLDPWEWSLWPMMFLVAGNTTAAVFVWFCGLLFWPYFLLQTGVGYFRVYAMINGLLGSKKSGTWKVTTKFGKSVGGTVKKTYHKPYALELFMALVFLGYAFAAVWYGVYLLASFCLVMVCTFLLISFGDFVF